MSFTSEFETLLNEKKKKAQGMIGLYNAYSQELAAKQSQGTSSSIEIFKAPDAFDDGYQFEDIIKVILGTAGEAAVDVGQGFMGFSEGIADWIGHNVIYPFARATGQTENDLKWYRKALNESTTQKVLGGVDAALDEYSVLGHTSDAVMQGVGQFIPMIAGGKALQAAGWGAQAAGLGVQGMMGLNAMGSAQSEAYEGGATDGEALAYGAASAGAELLFESLFGGMGKALNMVGFSKGLSSLDDIAAKGIAKFISSPAGKNVAQMIVKGSFEGLEELGTGFTQALAKKLTYMSEEEFGEILKDENLFEQFIVGALVSDIAQVGDVRLANKTGTDLVTGFTRNEQAVIDMEVENRIAQEQKGGKKLSGKEKSKIYDQVVKDMERGYISTETIESVLGKDALTQYDALSKEAEEFKTLYETEGGKLSEKQKDRLAELKEKNKANPYEQMLKSQREKISKDVSAMAQNDRLGESYAEQIRKGEKFQADVSKYSEAQRKTIQNAIDSGILNNTNRSHEFVDLIAKISADKGVPFDFADNAKLKESGFALDGVLVNGFVNESGVTINVQSAKALNRVVGHEITHVLEGTELYDALQSAVTEYAKGKKEYDSRLKELTELYKGKNANVELELVADLVGDYLFTDADFINHLSTANRNLFQKIYDEIKYLYKVVTAGTKEARQLEKVKKAFADAYRAETKNPTKDGGVRHALSNSSAQNDITANYQKTVDSILQGTHTDTSSVLLGYTPDVYQELGMPALPFVIGPGHIYSTVKTEAEARAENRYSRKMHYHGLGDNAVKNIYTAAQDPLMIIASKDVNPKTTPLRSTHSVVAIVDVGTGNQHLLLPVEITAKRTVNGEEMDVNVLSSAYNKNVSELVREAVALENIGEVGVYYIKKGATLPADSGVQFPVHLSNKIASGSIIHNFSEKVNMNIMDPTQSQQFKRWFGDWQNNPKAASKVVNADGTPKVVYHGTDKAFHVFDSDSGMYWFSEYEDYAESMMEERGGGEVKAVYLNMRNPYKAKLPPGQFSDPSYEAQILQNAKAAGHDGVIIENDTTDPLAAETFYVVFDPKQIKSATDNIGTFDSSNPDIRYSLSKKDFSIAPPVGADVHGKDIGYDIAPPIPESVPRTNKARPKVGDPAYAPIAEGYVKQENPDDRMQEKPDALYGPWRMQDSLDIGVEKLYRMMLREQIPEEEYVAQLVKADRLYQKRGEQVESALERVREAYSRNSVVDADSEQMTVSPEQEQKMTRLTRKVLHKSRMETMREALETAGFDLDELLSKAKRLSTFATVDNTPQRVIEKTFGYEAGQIINDLTVNKVALNESEGIRWLNSRVEAIKNLSKKYGIKPGSKESRAAQIYGEGFWVNEAGEYITYGDMELAADFPDVKKQERIKKLGKDPEVRKMYDETLEAINEVRVRNGYPPIPKRADYFLHFRAMDDTFSRLGVPFNPNDIKAKDLPTDLNGMTADLKPGKPFFASEMQRKGDKTTYDLLGGLERYMNSAKNQIYHVDDIQTFRAFRNYIADMFGQANGLSDIDSLSPEEQEIRIKEVYDGHLSTFAKFLNEEANILAGKTALIDRGVEGVLGRRAIQFLHEVNGQVGKNYVGWNVSSAGTNVLPIVEAMAKLPKVDMVRAFAQTVSNKFQNDGFVENDLALIRRRGADRFAKTFWQKISDPGYALMSAVDNLSSEVIVRAKYNELTRKKGMDSQKAHIRAGEWASRLMGDRSLGQMPQLYNSKTLGLITKFQLEVRNFLDSAFYDTIQEAKVEDMSTAKKAAKITSTMVQLAVFQHLFGKAFEAIAGYNPAFDIVENLIKLFGFDDDEESEDTFGDNLEQALLGLRDDMPYLGTLTGGRIPIGSALPIKEFITGKDSYGNEKDRLETIGEALPYYILPGGWGQIKKTAAGLQMFDEDLPVAGSYTDSGNLRFPVEDTFGNKLQAGLFGQYASQNARDYFDNGRSPLKTRQIHAFMCTDMSIQDYWAYREGLSAIEADKDEDGKTISGSKKEKVVKYIEDLDISDDAKHILLKYEYPSDDTYNYEIIDYLNSRTDISYTEIKAILEELGFTVDTKGNITWD